MDQSAPLFTELRQVVRRNLQATGVLLAGFFLVAYAADLSTNLTILIGAGIVLSLLPVTVLLEVKLISALAARQLRPVRLRISRPQTVAGLSTVTGIIADQSSLLIEDRQTVTEFIVGRSQYNVTDTGSGTNGAILDKRKHALTEKALLDLELFFEACLILGQPSLAASGSLRPALANLANKSGLHNAISHKRYKAIQELPTNPLHNLSATVVERNNQTVLFVQGTYENIRDYSAEVWDHGHIRVLTTGDRRHFEAYSQNQETSAQHCRVVAYKVLPKNITVTDFNKTDLIQGLIILGLISADAPLQSSIPTAVHSAVRSSLALSFISDDSTLFAKAIALKAGVKKAIRSITGEDFQALTDHQIMQSIQRTGAVFTGLNEAEKQRLITLTKEQPQTVSLQSGHLSDLIAAIGQSRHFHLNTRKAIRILLTVCLAELGLVLIGLLAVLVFSFSPPVLPIQILLIDILILLVPITALLWDTPHSDDIKEPWRDQLTGVKAAYSFIGFGLLAALISYANFLFFFDRNSLSPAFIATDTPLYLQATTVAWVTLAACLGVHLFFERVHSHAKFFTFFHLTNNKLLLALGGSVILLCTIIYTPLLSGIFKSAPLGIVDWLMIISSGSLYFAIRLSQRQTRKHARDAVVRLYKEVNSTKR